MNKQRQSTGVPGLDECLGGGLLPGTLTVLVGATGVGKTQFGLQYLHAGLAEESRRGILLDLTARGDSQNHPEYAQRLFDWQLVEANNQQQVELDRFFDKQRKHGDYLHAFDYRGRRVTKNDLDWDAWRAWQGELNAKLSNAIAFLYGNFVQGTRRVVIDGIEPVDRPHESIQFLLFEYVYHQVLRKDPEWVARDLFREQYRQNATSAAEHRYEPARIGCLLLYTSREVMLDDLISRPLDEGDVLSNANTLIFLGKVRDGQQLGRALHIAKHRGSACDDGIIPFKVGDQGIRIVAPNRHPEQ
jgi:KaiC/GvpD/RAD55 family RecA-like ATPase